MEQPVQQNSTPELMAGRNSSDEVANVVEGEAAAETNADADDDDIAALKDDKENVQDTC